ncbi:MAG TPA: response regulator [Thermoanaerobaculia bacterium]|nr:response regulator [Thermoanaerobaculia bacterium]
MDARASGPVLVVEDDPEVRDVIEELLRIEGFAVQSAVDGAEALARIRTGLRPSLILLDSMMPRMNGAEFLRARELDDDLLAIPVYLISASGDFDGTSSRYRIEGFLQKPFDPERLLEIVGRHAAPRSRS